jgi:hypothetical protein
MKTLVDCHFMESRVGNRFLALVSGSWVVKEFAPVILISFGNFWFFLFFVNNRTFGRFERGWLLPELRYPPVFIIRSLAREPLQIFEDGQEIFSNMGMRILLVFRDEGAEGA